MKLLIIRHGDPDYEIDGLTEKGKREAALLADRLALENITAAYCSSMGRAQRTAEPTLARLGITAELCDWLREFEVPRIRLPYLDAPRCCWDLLPEFVSSEPDLYSPDRWKSVPVIRDSSVPLAYDEVCAAFDNCLASHGYVREGSHYKAVRPNHDTIALFCHYALSCVLLSHITNSSPYSFWQNTFLAPTSVTTIYTEERRSGIASLRCSSIGDISHLYVAGEPASFSGRFCECFSDDSRHD